MNNESFYALSKKIKYYGREKWKKKVDKKRSSFYCDADLFFIVLLAAFDGIRCLIFTRITVELLL